MTLHKIREKIAALPKQIVHVMDGTPDEWSEYESINRADTLEILDAAIAEERAERECQPDGDKCIGCTTPPSGTTCALHGTVASVAEERAESDEKSCDGCLHEGSSNDDCRKCCDNGLPTYRNWIKADLKRAKPEPGDVVAWRAEEDGRPMVQIWPKGLDAPSTYVVLMRAAEVERKIEEAGE